MILVFVLYFICAAMFTVSKWALGFAQPIFFAAVRMSLAGLMLLSYSLTAEYKLSLNALVKNIKVDWFLLGQLVLFHVYLTYICDLCALKQLTSVESAFLYNLSPFIAAFFSYFWFGEKMTERKWIGLFLGFISLIPLLYIQNNQNLNLIGLGPYIITFIAVVSSAYGWIIVRQLVKNERYSPIFVNGFSMFLGGLLAFITSLVTEPWSPYPFTHFLPFIQSTVLVIVIANLLFYNLYGYLLRTYTATFLSFAGFTCPLFASLLGWYFLSEMFSIKYLISFLFVAIGLYIFYHEELRQGYTKI
jgi:drug/metabolite transporter (DMT)-like permease